jgi:hypothetical protein
MNNTLMFVNWVQIETGKTLRTLEIDHNNFLSFNNIFPIFMWLKHVQSLTFDFKFYIIQNFNILIKSIAC